MYTVAKAGKITEGFRVGSVMVDPGFKTAHCSCGKKFNSVIEDLEDELDLCGGCWRVGSCAQEEETYACNYERNEMRAQDAAYDYLDKNGW